MWPVGRGGCIYREKKGSEGGVIVCTRGFEEGGGGDMHPHGAATGIMHVLGVSKAAGRGRVFGVCEHMMMRERRVGKM